MNITDSMTNPDSGKSMEHLNAEKFYNNVVHQFNRLSKKKTSNQIITACISIGGMLIEIDRLYLDPPSNIICTSLIPKQSFRLIVSHYTNCQFIFSIDKNTDEKKKEIGFGKPEED